MIGVELNREWTRTYRGGIGHLGNGDCRSLGAFLVDLDASQLLHFGDEERAGVGNLVELCIESVERTNDAEILEQIYEVGAGVDFEAREFQNHLSLMHTGSECLPFCAIHTSQDFTELANHFDGCVEALVLLGRDAPVIEEAARKAGFTNIYNCKDMPDCVRKAAELAKPGQKVLLSPACASWDMYDNFEQRGRHFKECVKEMLK